MQGITAPKDYMRIERKKKCFHGSLAITDVHTIQIVCIY